MNETPHRDESAEAAKAARELAQLQDQAEQARSVLHRLQQEIFEAEQRLDHDQAAQLLETNEQLVLAMLRVQSEAQTARQALAEAERVVALDALTGLPQRALLLDRFTQAIAAARRHGTRLALLCVGINDFKRIDDTLGHAVGDEVLKHGAQCLAPLVREPDTASHHGGDGFLVLLSEVSQASDAVLIAEGVVAALGAPRRVGEHVLRLTASIGISMYPEDGEDAGTLIDRADAAMYRAKRSGMGSSAVFLGEQPASDRSRAVDALEPTQPPFTHHELAMAEHERRHAQMREANGQLVIAALSAQQLQSAAEQAHRQQTEFLAVVAHELRNPLTPIRTAAALLGRVRAEELPRMQAIIERQVTHMSRLVGDLLDVSRVNTGKLRLEPQRIALATIIDEAVDACRPAMDTRQQHLDLQLPGWAVELHGDPVRLSQVLINLLDNASKYTPDRGRIELAVEVEADAIVFTVVDSGIGISAEVLPHVFDPFIQDPHATGFNGVGLGIGLTVVRELVEAHGGTVVARSQGAGQGSRFVVRLPTGAAEPALEQPGP